MDPKFQSSFIPKGPIVSPTAFSSQVNTKKTGLFGFLGSVIFFIAVAISAGLFGYEQYLNSTIATRGSDLDKARQQLNPDAIKNILRLNARILSTQDILNNHTVISPLFDFLESSTYKSIRYTNFKYTSDNGLNISMNGQARGYAAVALQADTLSKSKFILNPVFSDLLLDNQGNVLFSFKANITPELISYKNLVASGALQAYTISPSGIIATSTTPVNIGTSTPIK